MNWPVQPEWLLVAAIYGFFAKDWLWLLRRDELALLGKATASGGVGSGAIGSAAAGSWQLAFGSHRNLLAGREPWALALWHLHQPVWRLSWNLFDAPKPADANAAALLRQQRKHLLPVGLWAWPLAALLLLALPLALLQHWGTLWVLAIVGLMYALLFAAIATAWWNRKALGLPVKQLALVSFECLACPPYGIHLVRRLSLALPAPASRASALTLTKSLLDTRAWHAAASQLRLRLHSELAAYAEESPEALRLKATLSWVDSQTATTATTTTAGKTG